MLFKRIIISIIALIAFSMIFFGCSGQDEPASSDAEPQATETASEENMGDKDDEPQDSDSENSSDEGNNPEINSDYIKTEMDLSNMGSENLVDNPSVEDVYENVAPYRWYNNTWGNNITKFKYLKEGHTGERSLLITVSDYEDGDSKWYFRQLWLEPGDYYTSHYYRSDVDTEVMVMIIMDDYTKEYLNLKIAPASEEWTKYEAFFTMPEDAKCATVYHLITQDGYLNMDDFLLSTYEHVGFSKALVTVSFDDGWIYNNETVLPVMKEYGFKSNQFYATDLIRNASVDNPKDYIQPFIAAGHEIGSHTITHSDLETLTDEELRIELEESKKFLENYFGIEISYFAAPYGVYDSRISEEVMKYYRAHRTVDSGYNSLDNMDASRLMCMPIVGTTTVEDVRRWVQKAEEEHLWLILLFHDIYDEAGYYGATPEMFAQCMQVVSEAEIEVVTISEALEVIEAEIK